MPSMVCHISYSQPSPSSGRNNDCWRGRMVHQTPLRSFSGGPSPSVGVAKMYCPLASEKSAIPPVVRSAEFPFIAPDSTIVFDGAGSSSVSILTTTSTASGMPSGSSNSTGPALVSKVPPLTGFPSASTNHASYTPASPSGASPSKEITMLGTAGGGVVISGAAVVVVSGAAVVVVSASVVGVSVSSAAAASPSTASVAVASVASAPHAAAINASPIHPQICRLMRTML